jgi:1,4-alpha-glucan branching enzyme
VAVASHRQGPGGGGAGTSQRRWNERPALWEQEGFSWIDPNDADHNVFSFIRWSREREPRWSACATSRPWWARTTGSDCPAPAVWVEVLNTDDAAYGGSDVPDMGVVGAQELGWVGQPASARMTLPPLATVWLTPS